MQKIKSKDTVIVLAGKDKGKTGVVSKIISPSGKKKPATTRVIVEGVNIVKRHTRGNPSAEQPGGIIQKEASIDISNVALLNPKTGKADRVGFKIVEDRKVRVFKSTGEVVDV
jgi:large subunit ribosomal protein L24